MADKLATAVFIKALYSLVIAIVVTVSAALAGATDSLGFLFSFGLEGVFFWAVFLYRRQITSRLVAATTRQDYHERLPRMSAAQRGADIAGRRSERWCSVRGPSRLAAAGRRARWPGRRRRGERERRRADRRACRRATVAAARGRPRRGRDARCGVRPGPRRRRPSGDRVGGVRCAVVVRAGRRRLARVRACAGGRERRRYVGGVGDAGCFARSARRRRGAWAGAWSFGTHRANGAEGHAPVPPATAHSAHREALASPRPVAAPPSHPGAAPPSASESQPVDEGRGAPEGSGS